MQGLVSHPKTFKAIQESGSESGQHWEQLTAWMARDIADHLLYELEQVYEAADSQTGDAK